MTSMTMQKIMLNSQVLAIWKNPIVWKNYHSRMRMQALFQLLLVFVVSAFMTLTIYSGIDRMEGNTIQAARAGIIPLGILQWVILMLSATKQITSGIIHERVTGTLDYTRLTPMSPMTKVVGYLFGLPIREYMAFFITMPFMIFLLVKGEVALTAVIPVYIVFFTSAIMYHLIGTVFGLVLKEWRMSVVLTVGVVILINWVLPLFSYAGFPFLQYLTIRPVVIENIFPYLTENSIWQDDIPELSISTQVDFFNWKVSTTLFSLVVQGGLIFSLGLMVYRKWENSFNHSLSKAYAVCFFIGLQVFCIGTMWPILSMEAGSSPRLGLFETNISFEDIAFVLPLIYSFFSLITVFWLLYVVTPTRDEYRSGLLRNRKLQQMHVNRFHYFDDHAGSLSSAAALAFCTFIFLVYIQMTLSDSGAFNGVSLASLDFYKVPLTAVLVICYFYVSLEYLELNKFAILFLVGWIVPILLAIFAAVAFEIDADSLYIASASPITLILLSIHGLAPEGFDGDELAQVRNYYWVGMSFIFIVTAILGFLLKELKYKTRLKIEESRQA